jgi:hypothetical protein
MMFILKAVSAAPQALIFRKKARKSEGDRLAAECLKNVLLKPDFKFCRLPLFFLIGALFPVRNLPDWLKTFGMLNPVSYAVDALRSVIPGITGYSLLPDFFSDCLLPK